MAVGRSVPDQVNAVPGSTVMQTGMEDQTPKLRRDYAADREKALRDHIAAYEAAGLDTSHLKSRLGKKPENVHGYDQGVRLDGPAHLDPRKGEHSPPSQVYAPVPESVPEPEDLSAPDKREQDQSPVPVKGAAQVDESWGGTSVVTAKDPGPEAPRKKADGLPEQLSPPTEPEKVPVVKSGPDKGAPALPDQEPVRDRAQDVKDTPALSSTSVEGKGKKEIKSVGPRPGERGADEASQGEGHSAKKTTAPKPGPAKRAGTR